MTSTHFSSPSARRRQRYLQASLAEYGADADTLNWITPQGAQAADAERARRLADLAPVLQWDCRQTKPHLGDLSPGCRICTQGAWSCLFINGKCNCRCFYCPTPQDDLGVPTTNRMAFARPADYAAYIEQLGFGGASISGGEPLLSLERTLKYIEAVRQRMGEAFHLWLYTNGTLLTADIVRQLKQAGLKEIRFDISAVNYDLKKIELAAGAIDCVTVEIPAIPEDRQRLIDLLPLMSGAGVRHLNLHQLRLTPHNRQRLQGRPYTFLPGEKVTVLESELTALAVMQAAAEQGAGPPINYCSFVYKHRYQRMAVRRRNAPLIAKPHESVTENGFIRTLWAAGAADVLERQARRFSDSGAQPQQWQLSAKKDRLIFHADLWPLLDADTRDLRVSYASAVLAGTISYRNTFKEIRLSPKTKLYVEKIPVLPETALVPSFGRMLGHADHLPPPLDLPEEILECEAITPGLQDYF